VNLMVCEITRCQLYAHESKIGQLGAVDAAWSGRLSRLQAPPIPHAAATGRRGVLHMVATPASPAAHPGTV
jgi:hypothetical protein